MIIPMIPFTKEGNKIFLSGPVFLSCSCGGVVARWATVQQSLPHIPHCKPKASRIVYDWLTQEKMWEKHPILKQHQFGVVVAETEKGFELVSIMEGTTFKTAEKINQLIERHKEWMSKQSSTN